MKKLFILLVLLLFLIPTEGTTGDKWTTQDKVLEAIWLGLHTFDYLQTSYIITHPDRYWEVNPLLGRHPSHTEVTAYFIIGSLLHIWIVDAVPQEHRKFLQGLAIVVSGTCVFHNFSIGIKMDF